MTDKKEKVLDELFDKVRGSEAYAKVSDMVEKASDFVEKKIDEIKQSDLPGKVETLRDKAESEAETVIDHVKAAGTILGSDVEEVIDQVKEKFSGGSKKGRN